MPLYIGVNYTLLTLKFNSLHLPCLRGIETSKDRTRPRVLARVDLFTLPHAFVISFKFVIPSLQNADVGLQHK